MQPKILFGCKERTGHCQRSGDARQWTGAFGGVDIATLSGRKAREAFMAEVQPVLQNPFEAFKPLWLVRKSSLRG
jgi:hypothetical protein